MEVSWIDEIPASIERALIRPTLHNSCWSAGELRPGSWGATGQRQLEGATVPGRSESVRITGAGVWTSGESPGHTGSRGCGQTNRRLRGRRITALQTSHRRHTTK